MFSKLPQTLILLAAMVVALLFLKLLFDMNRSMSQMTDHIGSISRDVGELRSDVHSMNESMQRMEQGISGMGRAFGQGSQQIQQMNPGGMMQQMMPGGERRDR